MPDPQYCPTPRELDDLEVLLSGALAPRRTFNDDVRIELPDELADHVARGGSVELVDPEGLPLASYGADHLLPLGAAAYGPFRRLRLSPEQVRAAHPGAAIVAATGPLTTDQLDALHGSVVLLALTGHGTPEGVSQVGLVRATLAAARHLQGRQVEAHVVTVPLPRHGDAALDEALQQTVVSAYGDPVALPEASGPLPAEVAAVVAQDQPEEDEVGLVVFFTGLSGSGKSTIARALHDLVLEDGRRTVTSLDGDVVRRHLSAGLTFSQADRETNIRRIGWVAAEIARHRGVAICSPIAPYDATRQQVRQMVAEAGGHLVLVHVATPLEECERRDRKGLYAKARRGEIPEFTGISSPYEVPGDADVVVDTTGRSVDDCLRDVLAVLPLDLHLPDEEDN